MGGPAVGLRRRRRRRRMRSIVCKLIERERTRRCAIFMANGCMRAVVK